MPIIKRIDYKNIKGRDKKFNLSNKTIIHGGNGEGKTSVVDAIKLALLGEHDDLGKQGKKLLALCGGEESAYADIQLNEGNTISWSLQKYGETAKVQCRGTRNEAPLRLSLCPDEFWGKGYSAQVKMLLNMCGNSSMIDKNFISKIIKRIRVKDAMPDAKELINRYAEHAEKVIKNEDLSSLIQFETFLADERRELSSQVKQWKSVVEADTRAMSNWEQDGADGLTADQLKKLEEAEKELSEMNEELEKMKAMERKKMVLMSKENAEPSKATAKKLEALHEELGDIGERVRENSEKLEGYIYHKASERNPERMDECVIRGKAVWTGESFELLTDSIEWAKDETVDLDHINSVIDKLNSDAEDIAKLIIEIEQQPDVAMSIEDRMWLQEAKGVNHEQYIAEITQYKKMQEDVVRSLNDTNERRKALHIKHHQNLEHKGNLMKAESDYAITKKAYEEIRQLEEDIIDSAILNAVDVINKVTKGIIKEKILWNGQELGRECKKNGWISINTFSGAEKAVTEMALAVALAQKAEFKLAVLDEASRLDDNNRTQLWYNLSELVDSKELDQFIGLTTSLSPTEKKCIHPLAITPIEFNAAKDKVTS